MKTVQKKRQFRPFPPKESKSDTTAPPELRAQLRNLARRFAELHFTPDEREKMPIVEIAISNDDTDISTVRLDDLRLPVAGADNSINIGEVDATKQAEHPDLTVDDMGVLVALIEQSLKGHVAPNNPTRFTISSLLAPRDGNGDSQPESLETCREIIRLFSELPVDDRKKILNGWNPEILKFSRKDMREAFEMLPVVPALCVQGYADSRRDELIFHSDVMDGEGTETLNIFIRAGVTKAEVMKALEQVTHFIDFKWDRMIGEPDKVIR